MKRVLHMQPTNATNYFHYFIVRARIAILTIGLIRVATLPIWSPPISCRHQLHSHAGCRQHAKMNMRISIQSEDEGGRYPPSSLKDWDLSRSVPPLRAAPRLRGTPGRPALSRFILSRFLSRLFMHGNCITILQLVAIVIGCHSILVR